MPAPAPPPPAPVLPRTGLEPLIAKGVMGAPLADLHTVWNQRRGAQPTPRYEDLMAESAIRLWPALCVSRRDPDGLCFRMSWVGLGIAASCRMCAGGCPLEEALPALGLSWLLESYRHCIRTGRPGFVLASAWGEATGGRGQAHLLLPCGAGKTVDAVIAALHEPKP